MRQQLPSRRRRIVAAAGCLALVIALLTVTEPVTAADLEQSYLDALSALASGAPEVALERLMAAEAAAVSGGAREAQEAMAQKQLRVARRLAARSAEGLIPMALLHERAYIEHLAAERLPLAVRARETSVELLELYLIRTRRPEAETVVADLLTSIGGYLQENSMVSLALALYQRALELERDNHAALLGIAGAYERAGQYDEAIHYLDRLLDSDPGHREGKLRLGINLLRLERIETGEQFLREIIGQGTEDWILSLAYQELARQAVAVGEPSRGRALLDRARARLPGDPALPMQIAFLEDQHGYATGSSRLGEVLRVSAASGQPSPRALYARVGGEALDAVRAAANRHAESRLEPLAESLAGFRRRSGAAG